MKNDNIEMQTNWKKSSSILIIAFGFQKYIKYQSNKKPIFPIFLVPLVDSLSMLKGEKEYTCPKCNILT